MHKAVKEIKKDEKYGFYLSFYNKWIHPALPNCCWHPEYLSFREVVSQAPKWGDNTYLI